jgi:Eukaryotic aspartyl protease
MPGYWQYPCDQLTSIGFQLGGQNYLMNLQDFMLEQQDSYCLGALVSFASADDTLTEPVWILGSLWMKNVMSVFDLGKPAVGFGTLREINSPYGTQTLVPDSQRTALGTGPSASASATFTPAPPPNGIPPAFLLLIEGGPTISEYAVTTVPGTGPLSLNSALVNRQTGVPTSAGATVVVTSDIPVEALGTNIVSLGEMSVI